MNVPAAVGVPLIVIMLPAHTATTPAGNPEGVPTPVAPVVAWVIAVNAVLIHNDGVLEAVPAVFAGVTIMVPVAFTVPQPPVSGME